MVERSRIVKYSIPLNLENLQEDLVIMGEAIDKELEEIAETSESKYAKTITSLPLDDEGENGERRLLIDNTGALGDKGLRYKLYKFQDGWHYSGPLTKVR